ncbi:hypothetical protein RZ714_004588 [Escherichia coli]|uniref:hypothetical protein n=1 Tax=Escherichia coli TaxID=562 RepID=UPI0004D86989|nr:hypothetical protein [Escherichia coli]EIY0442217.1 hypothetical protein [Escherichia coli]EJZ1882658.1 hypothetical protein [Escherichia coli]EKU8603351.1 hypothetical protein [Escherichia coli]ELN4576985.1 hypothetical protein [Escherichia coli]ELN4615928.1 hypothetical protein [Escherichia coli]
MSNTRCSNESCNKEFIYWEHSGGYPGGKDKEPIICPYCGHKNGYEMTSGLISSKKIEEQ